MDIRLFEKLRDFSYAVEKLEGGLVLLVIWVFVEGSC
jgi:hypothetical protein